MRLDKKKARAMNWYGECGNLVVDFCGNEFQRLSVVILLLVCCVHRAREKTGFGLRQTKKGEKAGGRVARAMMCRVANIKEGRRIEEKVAEEVADNRTCETAKEVL